MELLPNQAPPDIQALDSLIKDYELGILTPTPNLLATIIQARRSQIFINTAPLQITTAA